MKSYYKFKLNLNYDSLKLLFSNPNAIFIIEDYLDIIDWRYLSRNPKAIHILENNLDKVHWDELSENSNAIHILEKNIDKLYWKGYQQIPMQLGF